MPAAYFAASITLITSTCSFGSGNVKNGGGDPDDSSSTSEVPAKCIHRAAHGAHAQTHLGKRRDTTRQGSVCEG
ncbi:hypothetical protein PR003_g11841 [Phytophthora rubi]|uniref:Uncharacterized protein n=1 Tax=Phytophthora rubi TaxID=129364 RepID=A0A6A4FK70_9STRA|nr:hypothetical protein PR003_g11841 [Phytophthora rubi]